MIAAHRVKDQALGGLEHVATHAGFVHCELQALFVEPHSGSGPFAIKRQRHPRLIGEVEGQVIGPLAADPGIAWEHALRRFAEGDRNDPLTLGHALPGAQEEWHAGPAPIVDEAFERDEGLGVRFRIDARLLAVAFNWPRTTLAGSIGVSDRNTLFFSSLIGPGARAVGASMAMNPRI